MVASQRSDQGNLNLSLLNLKKKEMFNMEYYPAVISYNDRYDILILDTYYS